MIAIVDYDMGNVASVANMLKRVGVSDAILTREPEAIRRADKIILPGVGAFERGMRNLRDFGLIGVLNECALGRKVPVLGICLGMQLLASASDEGEGAGLGWIDAQAKRFEFASESPLKVPHMGWNYAIPTRANPLIPAAPRSRFYFVHAYHVACAHEEDVLATSEYGGAFACAVNRDNVYGVQFHPEKSHRFGRTLFEGFVSL